MKEWITVAEAAKLVDRSERTIYEWIQAERIASQLMDGKMHVLKKAVARIAPTVKAGRPQGARTRP